MAVAAKPLTRNGSAIPYSLLSGPELVRLLPRHWTGRLIERCCVSERVVQDSVHARHHGKYHLGVHQAAILLAMEYQRQEHQADLATLLLALGYTPLPRAA